MRVIAGRHKGRRLQPPRWEGLRPTSDRLRETLFNVLAPRVAGAHVLDACAGTGAVGIEALSRGAAHVTFVDRDVRAVRLIARNLQGCGVADGYTIERGELRAVLDRPGGAGRFDIVFLDPPYEAPEVERVLASCAAHLKADGVLVLERASRRVPDVPASLRHVRDVRSGDSTLSFFAPVPGADEPGEAS